MSSARPDEFPPVTPGDTPAPEAGPLLRALGESAPGILWVADGKGAVTFVSRRWEEVTGTPRAAALGQGWTEALHPDDAPNVRAVFRGALDLREPYSVDCRLRQADAHYRWVNAAGRPHFGPGGELLCFVGLVVDIHDRKKAEIALRRTQQAARFLANASVGLADMADAHSALRKLAGLAVPFFAEWCAVDLVGDGGGLERLTVVHSEPRKAPLAQEIARRWLPDLGDERGPGRVARTGEPELAEAVGDLALLSWVRDDEHRETLRAVGLGSYICVPIRWGGKTRATVTLVTADEERRYEPSDLRLAEDLAYRATAAIHNAELYRRAVEADRRKDEFLAVLSHELRTPLNAIVGWTHILREGPTAPEMVRKAVETIHRNAQAQTQLISDILDISRIAAGKMRLDVRAVDLPVVIEAALDTLRPAAHAKRVHIETVLDPGAGPISGDASRLQQIVWNLLTNAIKFVPEKTGRVHVRLEAVGSHVRMTVEDNGPGIDPQFLPYVFDRFRQAESSSQRRHQGLGLGLSIARHLVELHGGTIRAENRQGTGGARFTVELPRRSVSAAVELPPMPLERHPSAEEPVWLDAAPSLAGARVVVVDDHEDARELLAAVLQRCGAEVSTARDAREALTLVRSLRPDVLLADIEMPGQSGYDLIKELRAWPAEEGGQTPAVALTAYATAHDRVRVLRAGFQMHVTKPAQPAELATVVASLARKKAP